MLPPNLLKPILQIALDVPLNRTFDYLSGDFKARVGNRVIVPFAGRNLVGVVLGIKQTSDFPIEKLKLITHVFDDVVFTDFKLLQFCADYYHYPLGQALISALPLRLRQLKPAVSRKAIAYSLLPNADISQISAKKVVLNKITTALQGALMLSGSELSLISSAWKKAIVELKSLGLITEQEILAVKASMPSSSVEPRLNTEQLKPYKAC